jgi:hypothetical protein
MLKITEGQYVLGAATAFAVWVFAVLPFLYGPVPRSAETSQPPHAHSEQAAQYAQTEPRGTIDAPFVVKVLPTPKTVEEAANEAQERREKSSTDWWLMVFTGFVAVFTLMLAGATVQLYRAGERQLKLIERNATEQSRDIKASIDLARAEFVSAHYPRIILRDARVVGENVIYLLTNIGATPAIIIESWIMVEFVEQSTPISPLRSLDHDDLERLSFAGGETKDLTYRLPSEISFAFKYPDTRRIGLEGRPPILGERYFVGTLVYTDDLKIKRRSIFRRRWDDASHNFVRLKDERDHEYAD